MMSSGGEGIGNLGKFIQGTIAHDLPVQLAVITGRNAKLKKKLEKMELPRDSNTVLRIFGYIENINDFMYASDVVFGKSGACTTVESLFMRKPIMFYRFVTGNEKRSIDYATKEQLGWHIRSPRGYTKIMKAILKSPEILDGIKRKYELLNFKSGTEQFCRFVAEALETGEKGIGE
jgi:UDP-N-acetylglucosamine:LPS N-acetylglucosamine transferase